MAPTIEHVVVLMLENRSFDHMLGFLQHPSKDFDGLLQAGPHQNDGYQGGPPVLATPDAKYVLPVDPDHAHDAVMLQLGATGLGAARVLTGQGFVDSYERKGRGLAAPRFEGLLASVLGRFFTPKAGPGTPDRGPLIMRSQPPGQVPVLSTLALQFGVCTRWFCSVPGETWPNRNFVHAATSDGTTIIVTRFYENKTIFELLEDGGKSWHIYYDDTPQVWAFKRLWDGGERSGNWFRFADFDAQVRSGDLPNYSFIEPNHRPPVHLGQPDQSNSQHPGNNLVANDQYDGYPATNDGDFQRGEALIARVYETLRSNPEVFEKTVLLITYDEHGGFYDHVPPPVGIPAPGIADDPGPVGKLMNVLFRRKTASFDFTMPGLRVPAIVVSPLINPGTVDSTVRDHAAVPSTLRALFAPDAKPLTQRDAWAPPFHTMLNLETARTTDLPDLSKYVPAGPVAVGPPLPVGPEPPIPPYFHDLLELARMVDNELPGANTIAEGPRELSHKITNAFNRFAQGSD